MPPKLEQILGSVTQHGSVWLGPADRFAPADRLEIPRGHHGQKDVPQAIASRRRHVAPALLLC
jgi:hypothetical protein